MTEIKFKHEGNGPCHGCDEKKPLNGFDNCEDCWREAAGLDPCTDSVRDEHDPLGEWKQGIETVKRLVPNIG